MKNWITISNILLGLGSIILSCAFFNFLILTRLLYFRADYALYLLTPLFFLAVIAYIVGFLDYFLRKKPIIQERNAVKPMKHRFSNITNPFLGLHLGAFSTPILLATQLGQVYFSRFDSGNLTFIFGVPSPMLISVLGGVTIGTVALLILYVLNRRD